MRMVFHYYSLYLYKSIYLSIYLSSLDQVEEALDDSQADIWALVEKMCDELASFSGDGYFFITISKI